MLLHGTKRDRSRFLIAAGLATITVAALAACSPTDSGSGGDKVGFTIAVIEPDITTAPLLAAAATLEADGYDIEIVELAEPELAIEGLARGDYAISAEATSPALIAIEQDAPIRIIADVIGNQWAVYSQEGIADCNDLVGQPFGIFSEGAVATAMVREWVAQECTEGEPEYLVIGGSDVRAQALLSGQIQATALEIADVVTLSATGDVEFNQLVDFGDELPDLHPQTVYANADFLANEPEAAQAFIDALIAEHEAINADPQYLVDLAVEHLGAEADDVLLEIANAYVDAGLFDAGALTDENMQGTIDFFIGAGVIGEGQTVEDVADLSFLR
jgi:ABC-type nitrate/sulfonate/bicarbonate transport system substrate-binding protein